jgi:hypothetical protein
MDKKKPKISAKLYDSKKGEKLLRKPERWSKMLPQKQMKYYPIQAKCILKNFQKYFKQV